jgi:hypothetical protein
MDNQHKMISGYRELTQPEIDLMNAIKQLGSELGDMVQQLEEMPNTDKRWVAIAKTELQKGIMFAVRAVARPTTF